MSSKSNKINDCMKMFALKLVILLSIIDMCEIFIKKVDYLVPTMISLFFNLQTT